MYKFQTMSESNVSVHKKIEQNIQEIIEIIYYLTDFSITLTDLASYQPKIFEYLYLKFLLYLYLSDILSRHLFIY